MGSRAYNVSDDEKRPSEKRDVSSAYEIGDRSNEGAHCCQRKEIPNHVPDPTVGTSKIAIDIWRDSACRKLDVRSNGKSEYRN